MPFEQVRCTCQGKGREGAAGCFMSVKQILAQAPAAGPVFSSASAVPGLCGTELAAPQGQLLRALEMIEGT